MKLEEFFFCFFFQFYAVKNFLEVKAKSRIVPTKEKFDSVKDFYTQVFAFQISSNGTSKNIFCKLFEFLIFII